MSTLLERVRYADGPDRRIDAEVHVTLKLMPGHDSADLTTPGNVLDQDGKSWKTTAISERVDEPLYMAKSVAPNLSVSLSYGVIFPVCKLLRSDGSVAVEEKAKTFPLAILAALLAYNNEPPER